MAKSDPRSSIPKSTSGADAWLQWHKDLKRVFDKKTANSIWTAAWQKRGSNSANTNTLREHLAKNGLEIDKSMWDSVVDTGVGIGDEFASIFKVGKWIGIGLLAVTAVGIGIAVINIGRKPVQSAKAAASLRTGGLGK